MKKKIILLVVITALCGQIGVVSATENSNEKKTKYTDSIENNKFSTNKSLRGIILPPLKHKQELSGSVVKGYIDFTVNLYHNTATNKITVSNVGAYIDAKGVGPYYGGKKCYIKILKSNPAVGQEFKETISIDYVIICDNVEAYYSSVDIRG